MSRAASNKTKRVIARRSRNMNMFLLLMVLFLMFITAGIIINGINGKAAENLVRIHSIETAEKFYAYISKDLTLVQKAAQSRAITNWFADEGDEGKKKEAFSEMMDYASVLQGAHMYFGIQETLNEYVVDSGSVFADLVPSARLSPVSNTDVWYYDCINSENPYTLNIDNEKISNTWRMWINHKVVSDGKVIGVFCSGLNIPDIFLNLFKEYREKEIRGYVIDKSGIIQSASTDLGMLREGLKNHISEESSDPAFAAAVAAYNERIKGFFDFDSTPVIIKFSSGPFGCASIEPIRSTDWSVVVIYNDYSLAGVSNLLPLFLTMLAVLLVYVAARSALMNRLIFSPLENLTHSVSEGDVDLFGSGRNDEIGHLARTIRDMRDVRQRQGQLLHAVNSAANVLLAPVHNEDDFEDSLLEGMDFIGRSVDVDRILVWRNETIDEVFCYVSQAQWLRGDLNRWRKPVAFKRPYSELPEWERKFLRNEIVNGPVSGLSQEEKTVLEPQGVKSILAIPLYWKNQFYGFYSFDDYHKERIFTEDEVNILHSAGLMIVSALNRHAQAVQIQDEHERQKLLLDATPLACRLWNRNHEIFECNEATVRLFRTKNKQEYMKRVFELSPEYQPDGSKSTEKIIQILDRVFAEGRLVFEWLHQTLDGVLIPSEVTLVRVKYGDDYVIAGYTRDLREQRRMINEIERRDNLLNMGNQATNALLTAVDEKTFDSTLSTSMEYIGQCIDADRIYIMKNETMNGENFFVYIYEWVNGIGRQETFVNKGTAIPYTATADWGVRFTRDEVLNGPVYYFSPGLQRFLLPMSVKSILVIPIYIQDHFWGLISFTDCRHERTFTNDEVDILRSSALMMVSAMNRNEQAAQLRDAHEHNKIMLNATPLACSLWQKDGTCFDCNDATLKLFNLNDKSEFLNSFLDFSPKYQPGGLLSSEAVAMHIAEAFEKGRCVFSWMHQMLDGTQIPSEVTLISVPHEDEMVLAGYMRDLREHNKMMDEIERRDSLLNTVNLAASILLQSESLKFEDDLQLCMGMLGDAVSADRVYIWENNTIDGRLCCTQRYEWSGGAGPRQDTRYTVNISYDDILPGWEEAMSHGECINGLVQEMAPEIQTQLLIQGVISIFVAPVFVHDKFWGFVGYDNCHDEKVFSENEQSILRSGGLLIANALLRNAQSTQLHEAHQQTQVLLDAMPLACNMWDKNLNIFGCNEENVRLFGLRNKQDFIDHFSELSPEFQPDGRPSVQKTEFVKKAFAEGRSVFEWIHRRMDGVLIPSEVTLVRVTYNNDYAVAAYIRDLREQKRMIEEIGRSANLINTVNQMATILLRSDISEFENTLQLCMGMMGKAVGADRVSIWKNNIKEGKLRCTMICEWVGEERLRTDSAIATDVPYEGNIPTWGELLPQSKYINKLTRDLLPVERERMKMHKILSVFAMPVFVHEQFWGFVGCDNCRNEAVFNDEEASILRSGSILIATALLRNDMTLNIQATAAKLAAIIASYAGIIWCVDLDYVITLFNGQFLNELGNMSSFYEGRHIDEALNDRRFTGIRGCIDKTFSDGPQDWTSGVNGKTYRIRTTPVCDDNGIVTNIMGTFDDVSERSRLQADLKEALDKAQEANRAKTSFLASMSHEMRTPLNAVIGLSELTIEDGGLTGEVQENLEKIYSAGTTLLSTVNDILDISKIEAGKFEIIPVEYDMPSLINDAITQSIMRIGEKPIQFRLDINENLPTRLRGDDLRVKQILNNLLSNAFKYTREGTVELGINCTFDGDTVWMDVRVQDTGIGIKRKDMDRLFIDYAQMDTSSNRKIEGTGLGLSITKRIVEMMDGTVSVESEYGKGSVFSAHFRQQFVTSAVIGPEVVNSLKNFHYSDQKRRQHIRMARIALPYAHVLIVDDVATNLDVAKGMMKPYGMQIDCVTSGQEAIDIIRDGRIRYNAIFMDHMMPEMDGIEAARIIREEIGTEYAKTVPIIALTANAIVGNEEMFLNKGFQAFLSKPIEIERLDSVIREWVRDKELEKTFVGRQIYIDGQPYVDVRSGQERRSDPERRGGQERRTLGKVVPGLDLGKGIERFGGDEESFLHVLSSYVVSTRPLLEKIRKVNKNNLADYSIAVHGIKGSSRGICAELMGTKAEIMEKAAKEKDISFVTANNGAFIATAEKLIDDIEKMLKEIDHDNPKPKKEKPDDDALDKLLKACVAYDMDGVDEVMAEIMGYDYVSDDGLAWWLRENVEHMNFDLIISRLSKNAG